MKVCIIAEGSYPYVIGGVSTWVHELINLFPQIEFTLVTIVTDRSIKGKYIYNLPNNLSKIYEVYLQDFDWLGNKHKKKKKLKVSKDEIKAIENFVMGQDLNWHDLYNLFNNKDISVNDLLMGPKFLEIATKFYKLKHNEINFSDFLWTLRSMYLPLLFTLKFMPPKADIYHCLSTGYAGIIGSKAVNIYKESKLLISEHGIYTREREQEIIKASWVRGVYKSIWIEQFKKMSKSAYYFADIVTALFEDAKQLQIELGCNSEKIKITPNGIKVDKFEGISTEREDEPYINIGAIVRLAPIKDIKTMINAFYHAQKINSALKLWIIGPDDEDKEYARECMELVANLNMHNVFFTGRVNVLDYIGKMDMLILTSISEGQPLTILEGFAAKKPSIATNVGNCKGLIYGENDNFGHAGIITPVMDISKIAKAILKLANDKDLARLMGERGYKRLMSRYTSAHMHKDYKEIYKSLMEGKSYGRDWD